MNVPAGVLRRQTLSAGWHWLPLRYRCVSLRLVATPLPRPRGWGVESEK